MSPGLVVWITGLSGSGKTTVSSLLCPALRARGKRLVSLDGDAVRRALGGNLGHNREERLANAMRMSRLSKMLSDQGLMVVCSTISLFRECHLWNRRHLANYLEVYLRVPIEELRRRDPKGLYRLGAKGRMPNLMGIDQDYNEPQRPHVLIDNQPPMTAEQAAERILRETLKRC